MCVCVCVVCVVVVCVCQVTSFWSVRFHKLGHTCMHLLNGLTGHIDLKILQFSRVGWLFWGSGHSCVMTANTGETHRSVAVHIFTHSYVICQ